jgi:hypothetical protein
MKDNNFVLTPLILSLWAGTFMFSLAISLYFGSDLRFPDEQDYMNIAKNVYLGNGFSGLEGHPTASRPPFLPFLIAFGFHLDFGVHFVKILNALSIAMSGLLLAIMLAQHFSKLAWLPLLLILGNPLIMFTSSLILPQSLATFLLLLLIFIFVQDEKRFYHWLVAGLVCGLLLSITPVILLTLPVLFFAGLIRSSLSLKHQFQRLIWIVVTCSICLSPWAIRNYVELGKLTPFSTQSGYNLILAYSKNSTVTSGAEIDLSEFINDDFYSMGEVDRDKYLYSEATEWMKSNPEKVVKLYFGRVLNYFASSNSLGTNSESSDMRDDILFFTYYSLLALALLRIPLLHIFSFRRQEIFLWIIYFGNAFASAVFLTRIRYRSPFDALLVLMASFTLCYLYQLWKLRKNKSLATN